MNDKTNEELEEGQLSAKLCVEHMLRMNASQCELPVTVFDLDYIVTVETKFSRDWRVQVNADLHYHAHHDHMNNQKDDSCAHCGEDLRHPIHIPSK